MIRKIAFPWLHLCLLFNELHKLIIGSHCFHGRHIVFPLFKAHIACSRMLRRDYLCVV